MGQVEKICVNLLIYEPSQSWLKKEIPELVDALSRLLKDFQRETGIEYRFVYMILGDLMNDYQIKMSLLLGASSYQ